LLPRWQKHELIDRADLNSLDKNFGPIEISPGAYEFEAAGRSTTPGINN
jgi:hypothetical protein